MAVRGRSGHCFHLNLLRSKEDHVYEPLSAIGVYSTATQAEVGVDMLITKGFNSAGISVLLPKTPNNQPASPEAKSSAASMPQTSKSESAVAVAQPAVGRCSRRLGLLAGAGALAIPGVGPLLPRAR